MNVNGKLLVDFVKLS